jgi:xanthosine utilization system XapX-like protein
MDLIYLGQIAAALVAILTLLGMLVKWAIVKPIKAYIATMTYAIQPYANGGKSLPDLIKKVDALHVVVQNHLTTSHDTPIYSKCLCKSDWHA